MVLMLVILIFTRAPFIDLDFAEPLLSDNLAVYRAQNYYTEFLWKYMENSAWFKENNQDFSRTPLKLYCLENLRKSDSQEYPTSSVTGGCRWYVTVDEIFVAFKFSMNKIFFFLVIYFD